MAADEPTGIDLDEVLRRARRRRRPRVVAAIAGGVLAVAAIATPVVALSLPVTGIVASSGGGGGAASAPDAPASDAAGSPEARPGTRSTGSAAGLPRCGDQLASIPPATSGLTLAVAPLTADASRTDIPILVTLRNTGPTRLTASVATSATLALSRDGIVIWHGDDPGPLATERIDLEPGGSTTVPATLHPLVCGPGDETGTGLPGDLPRAGAGTYRVIAVLKVVPDAGAGGPVLVASAPATLTLR